MEKLSSLVNTSSSPCPIELEGQVFTELEDTPVSNRYVVFTEDHLSDNIYDEEVATSEDIQTQVKGRIGTISVNKEDNESGSYSPHSDGGLGEKNVSLIMDEQLPLISFCSYCDSDLGLNISPSVADEEPQEPSVTHESQEDKKPFSIPPQSEGNKVIFVDEEDEEPASISPSPSPSRSYDSDGDPKASETISVNKEDNESGSYSPHSDGGLGEKNVSLIMDEQLPLISFCSDSDRDLGLNISPSVADEEPQKPSVTHESQEDKEPASVGEEDEVSALVSPRSKGNKVIFVNEEDEEPASISPSPSPSLSYDSDGDPKASETISVNEEDNESGSYSPHSDGDLGDKTVSLIEDEEPPLVSFCSDRDLGWNISPSVADEEPREYPASPKLSYYSERDCTISSCEDEPQEKIETFKHKTYVKLFIHKIIYQIYAKANMKPPCSDDLIAYLNEYIWERVKDEDICITDDSFKKMDSKIQKILRKELGNPNKVLFLLKYSEEPVVADCMVTILRKLVKRPSKKRNIFSRFFSNKAQKLWEFLTCCIIPADD